MSDVVRVSLLAIVVRIIAKLFLYREWLLVRSCIERHLAFLNSRPYHTPPIVAQLLLVSGEDRRHGRHPGYDLRAIARAVIRRFLFFRREGASTIEQQIVRVVTNRFDRTWRRKIREILLASLVADHFPKSVTPLLYLSIGYYGWRMNNFVQGCRRLALPPDHLSLDQAAELVARLKYPQPAIASSRRLDQIKQRTQYLKRLYWRHLLDGTYNHLEIAYGSPIPGRRKFTETLGLIPYFRKFS